MQNVVGEGDFEHYQGVWRMQSLPNCNLAGGDHAARLSYAVEIKVQPILLTIFPSLLPLSPRACCLWLSSSTPPPLAH